MSIRHYSLLAIYIAATLATVEITADEPAKADSPVEQAKAAVENSLPHGKLSNTALYLNFENALLAPNSLGIDIAPPEASLRAQLGLEEGTGLVITAAPEESGGAKAGLKIHDVIVQLDEQQVGDVNKLQELLQASDGRSVKLRVLRQGKPIEIEARPQKPRMLRVKVNQLWSQYLGVKTPEEHYRLGVTLSESDETLRTHLRLAEGEGLVVTDVVPDSAAAAAGIQKHDVLIVLDGKRLTTVEAINSQIQEIKDKGVELRLLRGGKEVTLQIAPRKTQEAAYRDHALTYWNTKNCQSCHASAASVDYAHALMGSKLRAAHSAWTDGYRLAFYDYARTKTESAQATETAPGPQQQIDTLKTQLAEMQKALAALEAALKPDEQ